MTKIKATIKIFQRKDILDPQSKTVEISLLNLGYDKISNLSMGRIIKCEIEAKDENEASKILNDACDKILTNPIMEDYEIEFVK